MSVGRIIVMAKAPRPGLAKSRLAAELDPPAAAAIAVVLMDRTVAALREFAGVEIRITPDDAQAEFERWRRPEWTVRPQGDGDLGVRLRRAMDDALGAGEPWVIVVGTDCPALTPADVREAIGVLSGVDVVLGPAEDGGYWLLGVRGGVAAAVGGLLEGIPWSTSGVYDETCRRVGVAGLRLHALRRLGDVDTLEDWRRWLRTESP